MMPKYHFAASVVLGGIFFYLTGSLQASMLCFLSGILLDADHLVDFWIYKGRITFSKEIYQHFYEKFGRVPVLLHSVELLVPIWLLGYLDNSYLISLAISIGVLSHLVSDFLSYELHPLSYSLIYRISKKFDADYICTRKLS